MHPGGLLDDSFCMLGSMPQAIANLAMNVAVLVKHSGAMNRNIRIPGICEYKVHILTTLYFHNAHSRNSVAWTPVE